MNTLHTRSPSPISRVAEAARELGWSVRHLAEHAFGRIAHRIAALMCRYRIHQAGRCIEHRRAALAIALHESRTIPKQIAAYEAFIAAERMRKCAHEAQS